MKAISLWQPWASAIAAGLKRIETRHWAPPRAAYGTIAIHAAKRWTDDQFYAWKRQTDLSMPDIAGTIAAFERLGIYSSRDLPLGAIVATATLTGCRLVQDISTADEREKSWGDFTPGRLGWLLGDIRPLDAPIPCKGHQGFFEWYPPAP